MTAFFADYPYLILAIQIAYAIGIIFLSIKIIMDTRNVSKTLGYLMVIFFLPIIGVMIYFLFGVNFQKNKFYDVKVKQNEEVYDKIENLATKAHQSTIKKLPNPIQNSVNTINFLFKASHSVITSGNKVELLFNGEEKFPKVFEILKQAKHHIHLEYYIYENDKIGNELADLLIKKARQGVVVRFLYDDFGSSKIGKSLLKKLQEGGVQTSPVNKIHFKPLANRINYRDHRKIIIVDSKHIFTGGINVADRYINTSSDNFWRDTHLYLQGDAALYFQYLFITNWIFAIKKEIPDLPKYFEQFDETFGDKFVQVAPSGPGIKPCIMMSTTFSIYEAKERIYITTPYFIPVESILIALKSQALAGVDVRLLVPKTGDSKLVNGAAYSYYEELLRNGVRIFFYEKGFVHAKTMLIDNHFSSVGTANMDVRSQELNFEVNTHIYDKTINQKLYQAFMADLKNSTETSYQEWRQRSKTKIFFEHLARLLSPLL
ncbi:MAG TPA: cardiolipin synthase [Flavobacteriaceae bacterium]|nr:cardiolipin synthase [Flavobacteriaceae bacterium]